ncbi:hypothetical protein CW304_00250 [Bacillus sp. UFRGS-B20]|nr:hypothetical protein CW304_00250 [Bacillus sp. UFRGS-B20]
MKGTNRKTLGAFCLFKKEIIIRILCIFLVINKLYLINPMKRLMCNMIHKTVQKCFCRKIYCHYPFILYTF